MNIGILALLISLMLVGIYKVMDYAGRRADRLEREARGRHQ